jgi:Insulin-induced protein (INSIG)
VPPSPVPDFQSPRFLNPAYNGQPGASESGSLSRAQSIINLTASTLFGIFSPTAEGKDRYYTAGDEPDTPWGTGAQTPIKRSSLDDSTYELMRDRSSLLRRRSSLRPVQTAPPPSVPELVLSLGIRAVLLFALGIGYGALVTRFRAEQDLAAFSMEGIIHPDYDWRYMTFWGVAGVALGALLPWFDKVWEEAFGSEGEAVLSSDGDGTKDPSPGTDWALVVRGVGAFMGIVFAIVSRFQSNFQDDVTLTRWSQRKLPWASTLQVSLTLALVNPFLWYLIDRSKPGFLLSAVVGLAGSVILLGINPDMMPVPSTSPHRHASSNATAEQHVFGGLASQETIETGIWMLSVLFCSCVCFGNIGRRLTLNKSAAARGRWGGLR